MKTILQYFANNIIRRMGETTNEDMFEFYYELGMWLDGVAINYFEIYLD